MAFFLSSFRAAGCRRAVLWAAGCWLAAVPAQAQQNAALAELFAGAAPAEGPAETLTLGFSDYASARYRLEGDRAAAPETLPYLPMPEGGYIYLSRSYAYWQRLMQGRDTLLALSSAPGEDRADFEARFAARRDALGLKRTAEARTYAGLNRLEAPITSHQVPRPTPPPAPPEPLRPGEQAQSISTVISWIGPRYFSYRTFLSAPASPDGEQGRRLLRVGSGPLPAKVAPHLDTRHAGRLADSILYRDTGPLSAAMHHGRVLFVMNRDTCQDGVFTDGRPTGICDSLARGLYTRQAVREMVGYEREGWEVDRPFRELASYLFVHAKGRVQLQAVAPAGDPITAAFDAGPAPEALFPGNARPVPFPALKKMLPGLVDVFVSPTRQYMVVLTSEEGRASLTLYRTTTGALLATLPLRDDQRVVMADWKLIP